MIAGIYIGEEDYIEEEGETLNYTAYEYELKNPIPSYLLALAAGNFEEKTITEQIHLFGENEIINEAYEELSQSLPKAFQLANDYLGPYKWDNYSILILPGSFPYSGMGNPCLSFISTCLINKEDQALIDIIFHNMLLSWSGNLVTNNNWNDYWMGAGITTFLRRKIYGMYVQELLLF